jgi:hypothetical protein
MTWTGKVVASLTCFKSARDGVRPPDDGGPAHSSILCAPASAAWSADAGEKHAISRKRCFPGDIFLCLLMLRVNECVLWMLSCKKIDGTKVVDYEVDVHITCIMVIETLS